MKNINNSVLDGMKASAQKDIVIVWGGQAYPINIRDDHKHGNHMRVARKRISASWTIGIAA